MVRRERPSILCAILSAVEAEAGRSEGVRLSVVASRANIAYDRLQPYLEQLATAGLITVQPDLALTQRGHEFLRRYSQWRDVLQNYGLFEG